MFHYSFQSKYRILHNFLKIPQTNVYSLTHCCGFVVSQLSYAGTVFQFHISRSSWATRDILCWIWKMNMNQQPSSFSAPKGSAELGTVLVHTYCSRFAGSPHWPGTAARPMASSVPTRSSSCSPTPEHQFLPHFTFIIKAGDCEKPVQILAGLHELQFALTLLHLTSLFLS